MKPRLLLCLALVLFTLAAYGFGPTSVYEINRTNLNTNYSFLLIKSEHNNADNKDVILYRVAVMMPNANIHPADLRGFLTIKAGEKYVGLVEVSKSPHNPALYFPEIPKKFRAEAIEYDFSVSSQYLSNSDFTVYDGPSNCCYRFALKDFVDEK
jgi:hypothetical protein